MNYKYLIILLFLGITSQSLSQQSYKEILDEKMVRSSTKTISVVSGNLKISRERFDVRETISCNDNCPSLYELSNNFNANSMLGIPEGH